MRSVILALIVSCLTILARCEKKARVDNDVNPNEKYSVAFEVNEKDLIPEGITFDPVSNRFFLSSINKHKIIECSESGIHSDFIKSDQDNMGECLGLKIDSQRRRLWALSNSPERKYSFVHIYNVDSRELYNKIILSDNSSHLLNDLVLTDSGEAYITDTEGNGIYFVSNDLSGIELFLKDDSLLSEANGITISKDNLYLYVASNTNGINIVNIDSKIIYPIENWMSVDTRGIDGLMMYNNSLIGIRNGVSGLPAYHAARYFLNSDGREIIMAELIDPQNDLIEVPTTGVISRNNFYCLAVTSLVVHILDRMDETELLNNPLVLKYKLN